LNERFINKYDKVKIHETRIKYCEARLMICIKCGLAKRGDEDFFICDDCTKFSELIITVFEHVHSQIEKADSIDPETNKMFSLLADSSFITSRNPQTAIFYKICEFIVAKAFDGKEEITEEELNREISTTRGWGDAFKVFVELDLIEVKSEKYRRVLILKEKTKKMARQYLSGEPISKQVTLRLAHMYAGYVLLYILYQIAKTVNTSKPIEMPYNQKPKTLWVILMFLWSTAFRNQELFSEEEMRQFISKRRIPSSTRGKIIRALQAMDGRTVQGLIKDITLDGNGRVFKFEDYVLIEMERAREMIRERTR